MRKVLCPRRQTLALSAMGATCETVHGDPIIYTGWDTDTLNILCGCGATIELPAGSGLWQILRAYIDHETAE